MSELDKQVWESLGFGDKWFPPDVPRRGPDWGEIGIKTIPCILPGKSDWNLLESFPPVSRDWNLAMWAAGKAGLFIDGGNILRQGGFRNEWEVGEINFGLGFIDELAKHESGPTAICLAILKYKESSK